MNAWFTLYLIAAGIIGVAFTAGALRGRLVYGFSACAFAAAIILSVVLPVAVLEAGGSL